MKYIIPCMCNLCVGVVYMRDVQRRKVAVFVVRYCNVTGTIVVCTRVEQYKELSMHRNCRCDCALLSKVNWAIDSYRR